MALGPRLDLRQSQSLVMTPQLRQAIKLLQSSNIEVTAFVEEELERNPLLEWDERTPPGPDAGRSTDPLPEAAPGDADGDQLAEGERVASLPPPPPPPATLTTTARASRRRTPSPSATGWATPTRSRAVSPCTMATSCPRARRPRASEA